MGTISYLRRENRAYGARARIGLIVPATSTVTEPEWQIMAPEGVTVHTSRLPWAAHGSSDKHRRALGRAAADLAISNVTVVADSESMGPWMTPRPSSDDYIARKARVPAVSTTSAVVAALTALDARRIAVLTPQDATAFAMIGQSFHQRGIDVVNIEGMGFRLDRPGDWHRMAEMPTGMVHQLVRNLDCPTADAVVINCADLPTMPVVHDLEQALGKPVISNNQATMWAALRAVGITDRLIGCGRLLAA